MSAAHFRAELEQLINRNSMENGSNTPDFILAKFLAGCLEAFDAATHERETWYGRDPDRGPASSVDPVMPAAESTSAASVGEKQAPRPKWARTEAGWPSCGAACRMSGCERMCLGGAGHLKPCYCALHPQPGYTPETRDMKIREGT